MKTDNQLQYTQKESQKQIENMEIEVKILFPEKSTAGYNDHWKRTEQEFYLKGFIRAMKDNEKAVNMHDELVESVKMLYQLAQQMSEAATKIKFKHDGIEQLLKQAEQK